MSTEYRTNPGIEHPVIYAVKLSNLTDEHYLRYIDHVTTFRLLLTANVDPGVIYTKHRAYLPYTSDRHNYR